MDKKYIFVACAMRREADLLIKEMNDVVIDDFLNFKIYVGTVLDKPIIVGVSGPGLINMSSMVSIVCFKYDVNFIINYGMVGGYGKNIHKHDLIIGTECMNCNSYVTSSLENGIDIYSWNFITFSDGGTDELVVYKSNDRLLNVASSIKNFNVHYGRIGSADVWNNEFEMINMLMSRYNIICEDMEAVAVYQVSEMFKIPCISIKGVSDNRFCGEEYDDTVIPILVNYVFNFIKLS